MAERRMFAKSIIDSDAFLELPLSSQALYFHFSMRADDEGFINNPRKLLRMVGASEDDYKLLIAKNLILLFESGIIVIKHWKIHNYIRGDRLHTTKFIEERALLEVKENGTYEISKDICREFDKKMSDESPSVVGHSNVEISESKIGKIKENYENFSEKADNTGLATSDEKIGGKGEEYVSAETCQTCGSPKTGSFAPYDFHATSDGQAEVRLDKDSIGKVSIDKARYKEKNEANASCEKKDAKTFITITLNDKTEYEITEDDVKEYKELYPAVDVPQALRNMKGWCNDHPQKRKTRSGIKRFIGSWLRKEQDRGGSSKFKEKGWWES